MRAKAAREQRAAPQPYNGGFVLREISKLGAHGSEVYNNRQNMQVANISY